VVKLNLADFVTDEPKEMILPLKKCADRSARICFELRPKLIQEDVTDAETFSQMSAMQSVESDGNFWEEDKPKESHLEKIRQKDR